MKIDASLYHLVVFLATLAALVLLIVTGHDNSPLLTHITGGLFGGVLGGSAAGAAPALARFISGPSDPTATAPVTPSRQSGHVRLPVLILVVFLASASLIGCAAFQQSAKLDPVATGCASASAAIKTVTAAQVAGYLLPGDQAAVSAAIATIAPICTDPDKASVSQVEVTALAQATASLESLAARYGTH